MGAGGEPSGRIKGAAVRQILLWMQEHEPAERMQRLARSLETDGERIHRELPALGILSSRWYPASMFHGFCDEIVRDLGREGARRLAREGGTEALERSFTLVHRMLLRRVASPKLHRALAPRLWGAHFDTGRVEVELLEPGRSIVRYTDWTSHHPFICDLCTFSDLIIYGAMGLDGVEVAQLTCVDEGDADCAHSVTWATAPS